MKRNALLVVCALFFFLVSVPTGQAAGTYINGIDANYPPFAFVNEVGVPTGFDVESMDWIAKKMGFTVQHQPMDWDGIIPALLAKKIDMVCSGMSISPERAARVTFSEPYWQIRKVFLGRTDSALTVDQIRTGKKRVGVQRGTNEAELLEQGKTNNGYNYRLSLYDSAPMAVNDLLNGRVDVAAMDSAPANDAIKKGKAVKIVGDFGIEDDFSVALRNGDAELLKIVNEGYKLLKADPFWKELQTKYLH